jgi:hypothetical protein
VNFRSAGADLGAATKADAVERAERHDENAPGFGADHLRRDSAPLPSNEAAVIADGEAAFQALHFDQKTNDGCDAAMNAEVCKPIDFTDKRPDHHRRPPSHEKPAGEFAGFILELCPESLERTRQLPGTFKMLKK